MGSAPSEVYEKLRGALKNSNAELLLPDDGAKYQESIKRWSDHCEKRAVYLSAYVEDDRYANNIQACVVKATSQHDVTTIIQFVRDYKIPFVVRGGGHSTSGSASIEDGLVIDLSLMRGVTVDQEKKTIRAEGGTLWVDVDEEAAKYGLATVGGTVNHTGVGGLTLGKEVLGIQNFQFLT